MRKKSECRETDKQEVEMVIVHLKFVSDKVKQRMNVATERWEEILFNLFRVAHIGYFIAYGVDA